MGRSKRKAQKKAVAQAAADVTQGSREETDEGSRDAVLATDHHNSSGPESAKALIACHGSVTATAAGSVLRVYNSRSEPFWNCNSSDL